MVRTIINHNGDIDKQIKDVINQVKKGTFFRLEIKAPLQTKVAYKNDKVEKTQVLVARIGIEYQNMAQNQNRITQPLPFGEYEKGYENYIISYEKNGKTTKYLRYYIVNKVETIYTMNGKVVDYNELIENNIIYNKKPSNKENDNTRIVKFENIVAMG